MYITIALAIFFTNLQVCDILRQSSIYQIVYMVQHFLCYRVSWISYYYWYFIYWCLLSKTLLLSFFKESSLWFEAAAWYWHFVDVVWLFLFISIYWWVIHYQFSQYFNKMNSTFTL